jgi:thioredoxin reductase (NADPH)
LPHEAGVARIAALSAIAGTSSVNQSVIATEVVIVGAGPAGLFQVFELGLLGIKAHVLDSLPNAGGQCTELYPDKPIYDIPALPICGAQELVDRLLQQIKPFGAEFHLGDEVLEVARQDNGRFLVLTSTGREFDAGAVVIAGGVGSFQPRHLGVDGAAAFEGTQLHYKVKSAAEFHGRQLAIFGGGDSALDWAMELAPKAAGLTLIHRRAEFRGAPASVARVRELEAAGKLRFIEGTAQALRTAGGRLTGVEVRSADGATHAIAAEQLLVFFGLAPKLGPIGEWGLALDKRAIIVDTEKFQSNIPGIFAIGDINSYPGKKKLILSAFHEAALVSFAVQHYIYPAKKQFLQYTTTSPAMQKRLGVSAT